MLISHKHVARFVSLVCWLFSHMFKARFAHLSTVMSRMHQRSEGYPFGSLVDFAPDPLGRKFPIHLFWKPKKKIHYLRIRFPRYISDTLHFKKWDESVSNWVIQTHLTHFVLSDIFHIGLSDPIFSFSQLGIHTRNLLANPRCTLVVQVSIICCTHL